MAYPTVEDPIYLKDLTVITEKRTRVLNPRAWYIKIYSSEEETFRGYLTGYGSNTNFPPWQDPHVRQET